MSIGDMLTNQLDEDSKQRVAVDRDIFNDRRIMVAKHCPCPTCGAKSGSPCRPLRHYESGISGDWIHVERETK